MKFVDIKKTESLSVEINLTETFFAIDGEKLNIEFKKFDKVREDISNAEVGELVGTITVLYPFAGLQIPLTLEVYHDYVLESINMTSVVFKLPFVNTFVDLQWSLYCKYQDEMFKKEFEELKEIEELSSEKCSCGGTYRPVWDNAPHLASYCSMSGPNCPDRKNRSNND